MDICETAMGGELRALISSLESDAPSDEAIGRITRIWTQLGLRLYARSIMEQDFEDRFFGVAGWIESFAVSPTATMRSEAARNLWSSVVEFASFVERRLGVETMGSLLEPVPETQQSHPVSDLRDDGARFFTKIGVRGSRINRRGLDK